MGTVTISGDEYTVNGTLADATKYINGSNTKGAIKWRALAVNPDNAARTMIDATRFLDQFAWLTPYDVESFRRDDALFQRATYEMMMLVALSADVVNKEDQGSNIASLSAGSASVSFFEKTTANEGTALVLPAVINRLLGEFLVDGDDTVQVVGGFFWYSGKDGQECHDDQILYGRTQPF